MTIQAPPEPPEALSSLSFQSHFWNPPAPSESPESPKDPGASLVSIPSNSAKPKPKPCLKTECPAARWVKGLCEEHRQVHWLLVPCHHRTCETCGPIGRYRIAQRIALGVRQLWPASWHTLTFRQDIDKKAAVRHLATYVKYLRTTPGNSTMQYVATYELTKKGRLHINLICAPWTYVPQRQLSDKWGARLWVEKVLDNDKMGVEAAAAYNPEALGGYLAKLEQAVPTDRRVSYSRGWPKLPDNSHLKHKIRWVAMTSEEQISAWHLLRDGHFEELMPGEYRIRPTLRDVTPCDCFHFQLPLNDLGTDPPPIP